MDVLRFLKDIYKNTKKITRKKLIFPKNCVIIEKLKRKQDTIIEKKEEI
jgi:hypothetical protein